MPYRPTHGSCVNFVEDSTECQSGLQTVEQAQYVSRFNQSQPQQQGQYGGNNYQNQNQGQGWGSTPSCYAQTHLYLFPLVSKPFDSFGLCPITRVHQSVHTQFLTHNRVPVTPNPVPICTMHSHPCHAMSSCTCKCYHASCIYIITHAHIFMHIIHASYLRLSMPVKMSYSIYQHVIFHTACYQLKPYTAHTNMSNSKLHVIH